MARGSKRNFLLEVNIKDGGTLVHPGSEIDSFEIEGLRIFLKCNPYPGSFKKRLLDYIRAAFLKNLKKDVKKCLNRLDGGFSLIVVEKKSGGILLARDRCGLQCVYYGLDKGKIIVSNSLKNIIPALPRPRVSKRALDLYFGLGFVPAPHTIYEQVQKVPAGSFVQIKKGRIESASFVGSGVSPAHRSGADKAQLTGELYERLKEAVSSGGEPGTPQTVLFSGGIDSSLVCRLLTEEQPPRPGAASPGEIINTLFIGGSRDKEADFAAASAAFLNASHRLIPMRFPSWKELSRLIRELEEPLADTMILPMTAAMKAAPPGTTFCWSGIGADDLFGGLYEHRALHLWKAGSGADPRDRENLLSQLEKKSEAIIGAMLEKLYSHPDPLFGWIEMVSRMPHRERNKLLGKTPVGTNEPSPTAEFLRNWIQSAPDFFAGALGFAAGVRLPDLTMRIVKAACVESRLAHYSPFLTKDIVNFSLNEAVRLLFEDRAGKGLIRELYRRLFPAALREPPGTGFSLNLVDLLLFYEKEIEFFLKESRDDVLDIELVCDWRREFLLAGDARRHGYARKLWLALSYLLWKPHHVGRD